MQANSTLPLHPQRVWRGERHRLLHPVHHAGPLRQRDHHLPGGHRGQAVPDPEGREESGRPGRLGHEASGGGSPEAQEEARTGPAFGSAVAAAIRRIRRSRREPEPPSYSGGIRTQAVERQRRGRQPVIQGASGEDRQVRVHLWNTSGAGDHLQHLVRRHARLPTPRVLGLLPRHLRGLHSALNHPPQRQAEVFCQVFHSGKYYRSLVLNLFNKFQSNKIQEDASAEKLSSPKMGRSCSCNYILAHFRPILIF